MSFDETACFCALNRIFGYTPAKGLALCEYAGSAAAVFALDRVQLRQMLGKDAAKAELITAQAVAQAEEELNSLARRGGRFVSFADEAYPALLKECSDPPLGLYIRGRSGMRQVFGERPAVAIVGTRSITPYGVQWCREIVAALSRTRARPVIVSGLAFGVDGVAHAAALEAGLPTVGVMATGIEKVYPDRHRPMAEAIAASEGGALVTDYPPGTVPLACNFMRRNRIIAGLSRAVILIESRLRGGGMITAKYACDYERDLYALPGRIDDLCSQGCNLLIRNKWAEPVSDIADLMHKLDLGYAEPSRRESLQQQAARLFRRTCPEEKAAQVLNALSVIMEHRGITADELCARLCLPYPQVSECVFLLESEGFIAVDLLQRCSVNVKIS